VSSLRHTLFQEGQYDKSSDVAIIRRLLQAGADPNLRAHNNLGRMDNSLRGQCFLDR